VLQGAGQSAPEVPAIPANIAAPAPGDIENAANVASGLSSGAGAGAGVSDVLNVSVLERMATAATKLKETPHADSLIRLMQEQEKSWQEKFRTEQATAAHDLELQKQNFERVRGEEQRKTSEYQQQVEMQKLEQQDKMARKLYQDQQQAHSQQAEQERQRNMQAVQAQEDEKKRSMLYQAQLDRDTNRERAAAEGIANAEQERTNRDIRDAQQKMRVIEDRETQLVTIRESFKLAGEAVTDYLSDPMKMGATVAVATGLALGVYSMRAGSKVVGQYVSARLTMPPLVRETSRKSAVTNPVAAIRSAFSKPQEASMSDMILEESLERRLRDITVSTARTRRHNANYRNLMLYGPPGTGKTMFAMKLAKQSGLDYAVLAGGDVAPLGAGAITELHRVFDWGESRKNGLVLFIDEAESFLRKRGAENSGEMSENMRNALSTFLYRTGTPSDKVMLVLATNEPGELDRAITDRVDQSVLFALPGVSERAKLLEKYFNDAVLAPSRHIQVAEDVNTSDWTGMAEELEGLSGRQIMKLANGWQAAAYASTDNTLTNAMLMRCIIEQKAQQDTKDEWAMM
jgi:ATPase family AAA domain-containing protein 3A/B